MTDTLVAPFELVVARGPGGSAQRLLGRALRRLDGIVVRRHGTQSARLARFAGRLLGRRGVVRFRLRSGGDLLVSCDDVYWLRHALMESAYEPEVDVFFAHVLRQADVFLDCGANIGVWSVAAARVIGDPARVMAVESATTTFGRLVANQRANDGSFEVLHRALDDVDDDVVTFYASELEHAASTMVEGLAPSDAAPESVRTVALRTLIADARDRVAPEAGGCVVIKLDVEGVEERLLADLDPTRDLDLVVVYEDHGRDREHRTSRILTEAGFVVAFIGAGGVLTAVDAESLSLLDRLKRDRGQGYNLVAVAPDGPAIERVSSAFPDVSIAH